MTKKLWIMSQVRKLLNGNKIEKHEYGHVIIGSNDYDMNDETIRKDFEEYLAKKGADYGDYLSGVMDMLKSGESYNGDVIGNTSNYGGPSERTASKLSKKRSNLQMQIDALTNNDVQRYKNAIHYINAYKYNPIRSSNATSKTKIDNTPVNYNYDTINDKQVYSKSNPINDTINKRFDSYLDYFENPDWSNNNEFAVALGNNDAILKTWWERFKDSEGGQRAGARAAIDAALAEVQSKPWEDVSEQTKELLAYFNIGNGSSSAATGTTPTSKAALTADFNPDIYDIIGDNFTKDKYGTWRLNPGATFNFGIPELIGKNIYFNQDFYDMYGGNPALEALRGLTYYNGALYKLDNPELAQILNRPGGFNELMQNGDHSAADKIILTRFTPGNLETPSSIAANEYSRFLTKPSHRYSSLTNAWIAPDMQPGDQIIQYFDLDAPDLDGPYKTYSYKFALLDKDGNFKRDLKFSDLKNTGNEASGLRTQGRVNDPNSAANGYIYEDPQGNGDNSEIKIYQDPNNPTQNVILHIPNINAAGVDSGQDLKLPIDLAQALMETKEMWLPRVLSSSQNRRDFEELMSDLVRSWARRDIGLEARIKFKRMGFKDDELEKVLSAWKNAVRTRNSGNRWDRRSNILVYTPTFNKNGGKMRYINKLATGGTTKNNKESQRISVKDYNVKIDNPKNAAVIGEKFDRADYMDLAALAADLTSMGITIVDPTNIGGMASGMVSSLARFRADQIRGTKGRGLQLAANLGMDAVTLLPLIGDATKAATTAVRIRKALPTIIKLASIYGMGEAVINSAKKIANGEDWTLRDLSLVVNAVTSGIALGKVGGFGKSQHTVKGAKVTSDITKSVGTGENAISITLKGSELDSISGQSDAKSKLTSLVKRKLQEKNIVKTDDEVASTVNSIMNENRTLWQRVRKKEGNLNKLGKKNVESTTKAVDSETELGRWWRSQGEERAGYLARLRGEGVSREVSKNGMFREIETKTKQPGLVREYVANSEDSGDVVKPGLIEILTKRRQRNPEYARGFTTRPVAPQIIFPLQLTGNTYQELSGTTPSSQPVFYDPAQVTIRKKGGIIKGQHSLILPEVRVTADKKNLPNLIGKATYIQNIKLAGSYPNQSNNSRITSSSNTNETDYGRWGLDAPSLYRYIDPLLGVIQFGAVAGFQNRARDLGKAAIEAGRYQLQAPAFNQYRTDSPALQQQRNYLMSLQQSGIKPVTSDPTQYYTANLTNQANLRQQLAQNTAQQSEFEWQTNKENAAIANQNLQNQINVANQNRQINAAINSALYNPDLQLNAERKQSFENKMLELRNKINKQTNILNQIQYSAEAKKIQDAYEKAVSDYIGSDIYNKWNNLGESGQSQYTDFKDYLYKNYKNDWETNSWGKWFDDRDTQLVRDLQNAQYGILVNPFLRRLLGTFHEANRHNESYKKGGYLRGTTRYTMEPDERI